MAIKNNQIQEPVPFEDFKFSLDFPQDPFLQQSPTLNFPAPSTHAILDEHDQKAFSSFLDTFFMDSDMMSSQPSFEHGHMFYHQHEEQDNPAALVTHALPSSSPSMYEEQEQQRRNSILQSLDEQKKRYLNHEPQTIYLRASDTLKSPYTFSPPSSDLKRHSVDKVEKSRRPPKKQKTAKELLTEEEKKANHIASEQKRRSTIRHGFKELMELIPALKNVNHSKSVVLFKAAEFIQNLEKRNRHLRHKLESLKLRTQTEGRSYSASMASRLVAESQLPPMIDQRRASSSSSSNSTSGNSNDSRLSISTSSSSSSSSSSSNSNSSSNASMDHHNIHDPLGGLPVETKRALMAHKSQQEELMLYQEQLQQSSLFRANKLPPILGQYGHPSMNDHTLQRKFQEKAIPAP
ncbi:hypothetical protein BD560DRAFT_492275 [Blakeslea trispora]|nr:hypothetical protein BD560DRAFT_492275 [Blakeslea trispora]